MPFSIRMPMKVDFSHSVGIIGYPTKEVHE